MMIKVFVISPDNARQTSLANSSLQPLKAMAFCLAITLEDNGTSKHIWIPQNIVGNE